MGKLRGVVARIFLYVLFGLLIISFAIWGIGDMFQGRTSAPVVAEVGSQEITQEEYRRALGSEFNRLRQMFGGNFDMEQAQAVGLPEQVLADLLTRRLYQSEQRQLGLIVTEDQIRQEIFSIPAFQNEQGHFDRLRYEQALRMSQLTEGALVQQLEQEMIRNRILSAVLGGLEVPERMAEALFKYHQETRSADYLVVPHPDPAVLPEPEEEELLALYEQQIEELQTPEFREVSWLHIDPKRLAAEMDFEEEELRSAYEERRNEYEEPERRAVQQILFESEEDAWQAYERMAQGASLEDIADDLEGASLLDLGHVTRSELPASLADPVFALTEAGEVSEPVESDFGWHLLRASEITPQSIASFEEVRDDLKRQLAEHEAVESAIALANRVDDELAAGATLEEAAEDLGLELHQHEGLALAGHDREDRPVIGLPAPQQFLQTAFSTEVGDTSLLIETEDSGYFVVRVDGVIPPAARPFESVRERLLQQWQKQELEALAFEKADELAERLRDGESLEAVAESEGLEVQQTEELLRSAAEPSPAFVEQLFEVAPGEVFVTAGAQGALVAVAREIQSPDPSAAPEQLARVGEQAAAAQKRDMELLYRQALERRYQVQINRARIDDVLLEF